MLLAASCIASAAPVASNLVATQRPGTKLVDIAYALSAPDFPAVAVSLEISSDGGATWTVPAVSVSGDIGDEVAPGPAKAIVWDAGADWPGSYTTQMRFRIVTEDGFASIPGGSFAMGRTSGDTDGDAPPTTVRTGAFYLAETETTKADWDKVRDWGLEHGYTDLPEGGGKGPDHPVHTVSWFDAVKWCNARSEREGLTPVYTVGGNVMRTGTDVPDASWGADGHRLPTEAEWEKAARGGVEGKRFPWGADEISHAQANYYGSGAHAYDGSADEGYHPAYATGATPYTSPVGSFAANGYGLHDMAGNLREWCWDWYSPDHYADGAVDPRGPATGSERVVRGGGWNTDAALARASSRNDGAPAGAYSNIGFRTARFIEFVPIPGGSFTMGRTSGDTDSNAPPTTVTVGAFRLAVTETTKARWDEVRAWGLQNGYTDLRVGGGKGPEHPVYTVNWFDVVKWCNARSEKEGLTPVYTVGGNVMRTGTTEPTVNWGANGYRLPTEAEWEKAARGGVSGKRFPWGTDTINHDHANYRANGSAYAYDTSPYTSNTYHPTYNDGVTPYTSPVGSFAANGYGLHDMAGNVWEWCWDWYQADYYAVRTDPRGPASGTYRVFRGGGWDFGGAVYARCADRFGSTPTSTFNGLLGFRTARSLVP